MAEDEAQRRGARRHEQGQRATAYWSGVVRAGKAPREAARTNEPFARAVAAVRGEDDGPSDDTASARGRPGLDSPTSRRSRP